uniref:Protein arginine methyltransferase NDUFAF7 n=1 Tax=Phallusia mammillata TaxID=59560 RepID=A0A6F9DMJ8_9ASCI|nr:NADH dehydrogenase [ubiquinone] complex I, assembly factor 7 [Phallusia mammillata]
MLRLLKESLLLKKKHFAASIASVATCNQNFQKDVQAQTISLKKHLHDKIKTTGPISVADFMLQALTDPDEGYYMKRDMFGEDGDFVTSPELSQMFGELIAIWIVNEWLACGSPTEVQVVELGPGRGTLMEDVIRTFNSLGNTLKNISISIHLVEISLYLSNLQHKNLCQVNSDKMTSTVEPRLHYTLHGKSKYGQDMFWHDRIQDVPAKKFTFFIAHEFFDALPVHQFVKDNNIWKEVYVDVCTTSNFPNFRFVLLPHPTLACRTLIKPNEHRQKIEVSPRSGIIIEEIARRIAHNGGSALIADYGHFGSKEHTLRGFKSHKIVDVLTNVGEADVTADVDFKYLKEIAERCDVMTCGPITQQSFLKNMGIDTRIMMLLRNSDSEEMKRKLIGSYDMLVNPEKMGEKFKFFSMVNKDRLLNNEGKTAVTAFA